MTGSSGALDRSLCQGGGVLGRWPGPRDPRPWAPDLRGKIAWGASPRASIALERCARAAAWLAGRDYVLPEDVQTLAPDVLRHRVLLGYEAEAEGLRVDAVVQQLLERVPLP